MLSVISRISAKYGNPMVKIITFLKTALPYRIAMYELTARQITATTAKQPYDFFAVIHHRITVKGADEKESKQGCNLFKIAHSDTPDEKT